MISLRARTDSWDDEPFVAKISSDGAMTDGPREIQISNDYNTGLVFRSPGQPAKPLPQPLHHLRAGDILRVVPRVGELNVLYRRASTFNVIMMTERCNSNCIMCSQPPRSVNDDFLVDAYLQAIPLMAPETAVLGISGGEPTLLGDRLLEVLRTIRRNLPKTAVHMLSNGRLFNYLSLARSMSSLDLQDFMIGIPLYAGTAPVHDFVVQARGAFDQTIRGIINLKRCGVRVEIRVVLQRATLPSLDRLADFITRNLPMVDHVALMGLEVMGYAKINLPHLWLDPTYLEKGLSTACRTLSRAGIAVSIYNLPLCALPQPLWPFARKSISDWKNEFTPECRSCQVREECCGFFVSTVKNFKVRPIVVEGTC